MNQLETDLISNPAPNITQNKKIDQAFFGIFYQKCLPRTESRFVDASRILGYNAVHPKQFVLCEE
jgi:hypothetical protein